MVKKTKTEEYLYSKIMEDKEKFSKYTLKEISETYFVSEGVVLRLVNKLGFNTLKEMQTKYYSDFEIEALTKIEDDFKTFKIDEIINNTYSKSLYGIIMTKRNTDADNLFKIKKQIQESEYIVFFGIGNSHSTAKMLSDSLHKIGFNTYVLGSTKEAMIFMEFCNPKKTTFIFYTHSGKTHEVVFLATNIIKYNIDFILITNENSEYRENILNKAKYKFEYVVSSKEHYTFPIVSAQFCQAIFNNIIINLLISEKRDFLERLEKATSNLNNWNKKV